MTESAMPDLRWAWVFAKGKGRGGPHRRFDDLERLAATRHVRAGGPPFGSGPGFGFPFGGGRGRARRGDVRIALLLLLAEEPRNGYQLMQEIEQRSDGHWRPSPGSVYPALSQLEDEGLVRAVQSDSGRVFEITDAGREQAERIREQAPPWERPEESVEPSLATMRNLFISIARAGWQVATEGDAQQIAQACDLLAETRRGLYRLLAEEPDAPDQKSGQDEQGGQDDGGDEPGTTPSA
jgi:DNA-binding PadR family transcriptional regulator